MKTARKNYLEFTDNPNHFGSNFMQEKLQAKSVNETIETLKTEADHDLPMKSSKSAKAKRSLKIKSGVVTDIMRKKMNENSNSSKQEQENINKIIEKDLKLQNIQEEDIAENSLFIFSKRSRFRSFLLRMLVHSTKWKILLFLFLVCDILSLSIDDYSHRIYKERAESLQNTVSFFIELAANIFFGVEIVLEIVAFGAILAKNTFFRSKWNILNFIIVLFSFFIYSTNYTLSFLGGLIKIGRFLRFATFFKSLREHMYAYYRTLFSIGGVLFNLAFFMIFYAILGLHLFKGLLDQRCRVTPEPIPGESVWPIFEGSTSLCGVVECPEESYCRKGSDYHIHRTHEETNTIGLNYGQAHYDNFLMAFVTNLNFISFTGWSSVNDIHWKAISPGLVVIYGTSQMLILGTVLKNLLIAAVYQGYVANQSGIKNYKQKLHEIEENRIKEENEIKKQKSQTKAKKKIPRFEREKLLIRKVIQHPYFYNVMLAFCLINTIILCMDHYKMDKDLKKVTYYIDYCLTVVFFLELILIAISCASFREHFFKFSVAFDSFIVVLAFSNMIHEVFIAQPWKSNDPLGFSAVKSFKIMRIFNYFLLTKKMESLGVLFQETLVVLKATKEFLLTVSVFIIILAFIGRELFAYTVRYDEKEELNLLHGHEPRVNYDTIENSILATIIIFFNEEWHAIMYEYMKGISPNAGFYFASVLIIGDFFCMKIFMALFTNHLLSSRKIKKFFGLKTLWSQALKKIKIKLKRAPNQMKNLISDAKKVKGSEENIQTTYKVQPEKKEQAKDIEPPQAQKEEKSSIVTISTVPKQNTMASATSRKQSRFSVKAKKKTPFFTNKSTKKFEKLGPKAMGIWDLKSKFRKRIFLLVKHPRFEKLILVTIIISCFLLMIRNPLEDPNSTFNNFLFTTDVIMLFLYLCEISLKVIAFGFLKNGKYSYMRDVMNFFDFWLLVITIFGTIDAKYVLIRGIYIKVLRSFRIFKLIKFNEGLRILSVTLVNSYYQLGLLLLFYLVPFLTFSVFALQIFKGGLYYCTGLEKEIVDTHIFERWDCLDWGGNWILKDNHFDNIFSSASALYQIATTEGWINILFNNLDSVGINKQPKRNYRYSWFVFFVVYFFICNIVMVNILLGIFVEKFLIEKEKNSPYKDFTDEQKEWQEIKNYINKQKPLKIPKPPPQLFKRAFWRLNNNVIFRYSELGLALINVLVLAINYHGISDDLETVLTIINMIIIIIFVIQLHFKIFAAEKINEFMRNGWNLFDIIITFSICIVFFINYFIDFNEEYIINALLNSIQVVKVLIIMRKIPFIKKLLFVLYYTIPQATTVSMLLVMVLIIYSLIGVEMFAFLKPYGVVGNEDINFRSVGLAMHTLVRAATGEGWYLFLSDTTRQMQPDYVCRRIMDYDDYMVHGLTGCGTAFGYFYWFSYTLLITWVILNLFFALLLSTIDDVAKLEDSAISRFKLKELTHLWRNFDSDGTGFISYKDFWVFTSQVIVNFGLSGEELHDMNNKKSFLKALQIPVYVAKDKFIFGYTFHDTIITLCKMVVIIKFGVLDLEPVQKKNKKELVDKIFSPFIKKHRKKYEKTALSSSDLACFVTLRKFIKNIRKKKDGVKMDSNQIGQDSPVMKLNKKK